jgi:hypothetical protein
VQLSKTGNFSPHFLGENTEGEILCFFKNAEGAILEVFGYETKFSIENN